MFTAWFAENQDVTSTTRKNNLNKKRTFYIARIILCTFIFLCNSLVLASSSASADDELHVRIPAKSVCPPRAQVPSRCV